MRIAEEIASRYSALPQVEAVALGGSQASNASDTGSDYDFYIYCNAEIPLETRRAIATRSARRCEIGLTFWEPGDEWIDANSGTEIDVTFRSKIWMEDQIVRILQRYEASTGYSTCFVHNVIHSETLYDPNSWYRCLRERAQCPYPESLRRNIIAKNYPLLRQTLPSYIHQLSNALKRNDTISVNHRVAAFVASYFDVLFAVNRILHPGEKRLLPFALSRCQHLPTEIEADMECFLKEAAGPSDALLDHAHRLVDRLDEILEADGIEARSLRLV